MSDLPEVVDLDEEGTPSAARLALRSTPLRERAGVVALNVPTRSPDVTLAAVHARGALQGRPRGLAALFVTTETVDLDPGPQNRAQPFAVAETLDAPTRLETEWLTVPDDDLLHHAVLDIHDLTDLADHGLVDAPAGTALLLACGDITPTVALPSALDAHDAGRCPSCCNALDYPPGFGSPKHDPACRPTLARRLENL